jgi:hypothetical protein
MSPIQTNVINHRVADFRRTRKNLKLFNHKNKIQLI